MHSASSELEIGTLLSQLGDPRAVAVELRQRWESGLLSPEEQTAAALFLARAGFLKSLFEILSRALAEGRRVPWTALPDALWSARLVPAPSEAEALAEGAEEQGAGDELLASARTLAWGDAFAVRRAELNSRRALELEEKRAQLWDMVRFMRANRLYEPEAKALAELRAHFPDDPEFASQDQSLQERWAREIIAQGRGARTELTRDEAVRDEVLDEAQMSARDVISEQAVAFAQARPERAVDFALLLHFMEFRTEAIEALDAGAAGADPLLPAPSRDWLRLELLLLARQFVTALDEAARLELLFASEPYAAFAVAYARARALWGLGETQMAIELVRSIVRVRPGYRSAQSLLLDWTGGDDAT